MDKREIIPSGRVGRDGGAVVPYEPSRVERFKEVNIEPETDMDAAAADGDAGLWKFWYRQVTAGLVYERRWRQEALTCERLYFGPDDDVGSGDAEEAAKSNRINDKTALTHSNIEVLKPLLYSDTPQPIARRRYNGDGKPMDYTDLMVAEAAQRLATYLLDTEDFDGAMSRARDDWLIAGRGLARVIYKTDFAQKPVIDPATGAPAIDPVTGMPQTVEAKTNERVIPRSVEWRRTLFAPTESWESLPWEAFETAMTRSAVERRFGKDLADAMTFNGKGLVDQSKSISEADRESNGFGANADESGEPGISPFDTAMVWEIWNREDRTVVWWSASYTRGVLDKSADPLGLERFFPNSRPLLATVKGDRLTPRPDIRYYEDRAEEVRLAGVKLREILNTISISGLFPGQMQEEVKKLLSGTSQMIPVESWLKLMDKGGTANIIQWLPLQQMVAAAQALVMLRDQAKAAMFEASGVSDIMRAQGDPNETATAQNLKGRYAGMRLSDKQRTMAMFALNTLRLMVEVAVEHFDTEWLAEITGLDLPMTEADRAGMKAMQDAATQAYQSAMAQHEAQGQQIAQAAQQAQQAGPEVQAAAAPQIEQSAQQLGEPPEPPEFEPIPQTSWELVHGKLRSDIGRKVTITIETQSTILADEQQDKEARVEFIQAFAGFVQTLMPLVQTGMFDMKILKELLLFGVRGFPKSRTLETMITSIPDEPKGEEAKEDVAVTVANIRAEVDKMLGEMRAESDEKDRQMEMRLKGADMLLKSQEMAKQAAETPPPQPPQQ